VAFALSIAQLGTVLPAYADSFTALVNNLESWLATLGIGRKQLKAALGEVSFGRIAGFFTSLHRARRRVFESAPPVADRAVHGPRCRLFLPKACQVGGKRKAVVTALGGFVHGTRTYLVVSTIFG
jgi:hypothetical protein